MLQIHPAYPRIEIFASILNLGCYILQLGFRQVLILLYHYCLQTLLYICIPSSRGCCQLLSLA